MGKKNLLERNGQFHVRPEEFRIFGYNVTESGDQAVSALTDIKVNELYKKLKGHSSIDEVIIVKTCNRFEISYFSKHDLTDELQTLLNPDNNVEATIKKSVNKSGDEAIGYFLKNFYGYGNSRVFGDFGKPKQSKESIDKAGYEIETGNFKTKIIDGKETNVPETEFIKTTGKQFMQLKSAAEAFGQAKVTFKGKEIAISQLRAPSEPNHAMKLLNDGNKINGNTKYLVIGTGEMARNSLHELINNNGVKKENIYVASQTQSNLAEFGSRYNLDKKNLIYYNLNERGNTDEEYKPLIIPDDVSVIMKTVKTSAIANYKPKDKVTIIDYSDPKIRQVPENNNITFYSNKFLQEGIKDRPETTEIKDHKPQINKLIADFIDKKFWTKEYSEIGAEKKKELNYLVDSYERLKSDINKPNKSPDTLIQFMKIREQASTLAEEIMDKVFSK